MPFRLSMIEVPHGGGSSDDIGGGDGDWRQKGTMPSSYVLEGPAVATPFCVDGPAASVLYYINLDFVALVVQFEYLIVFLSCPLVIMSLSLYPCPPNSTCPLNSFT